MALRYPATCRVCGRTLPARTRAVYERGTRTVRCVGCPANPLPETPIEPGRAGGSAWREYSRRRDRDRERIRKRWGPLGSIAVALAGERQSTAAWARGAIGEERLGALLDSITREDLVVLHDRRVPRSRANIDHLVITSGAVWVVDTKRYTGRPHLRAEGGMFRPRTVRLFVGRRNGTTLLEGVKRQVEVVRAIVGPEVPVRGALCFVDADWPLIGGDFTVDGIRVLRPRRLAKELAAEQGALDTRRVAERLAFRLPAAIS